MARTFVFVLSIVCMVPAALARAPTARRQVKPTAKDATTSRTTPSTAIAEDPTLAILADRAFLTGKVDNPKRIAEITKLGMSHWTTGDKASYVYTLASYVDEQPYPDMASKPIWLKHFLTLEELREYARFYDGTHEHFNLTPEDVDEIYGQSDLQVFAAQTNVCVPAQDLVNGGFTNSPHTQFDRNIVPRILAHDLTLTLNLGATNNSVCPGWDYKFALEHPLITKEPNPFAQFFDFHRADVYVYHTPPDPDGIEKRLALYAVPNPGDPAYLKLLRENIESRIAAFPEGVLDYVNANGEYFFRYPTGFDLYMDADVNPGNYMKLLPVTDYSTHSLSFFAEWLKRQYSSLQQLNTAWKTGLKSFGDVDPRIHASHRVPFYDWVRFQEVQRREFDYWQYLIAKQFRPALDVYSLTFGGLFDLAFLEFGYLRSSDGISTGDWYFNDDPKNKPLKMIERDARIALTSGEAFHFPFFGFPRKVKEGPRYGKGVLENGGQEPEATFRPPTYNDEFSWQTLMQWIAFGAETASLGYWEVPTHWSFHYGDRTFLNDMATFLKHQKPRLALMTPWRAPLLVNIGQGKESPLTSDMLELLTIHQLQYSTFKDLAVMEEVMWARSARDTVVGMFADIDNRKLSRYSEYAVARDAQALVFVAGSAAHLDLSAYAKSAQGEYDKYTHENGKTFVYHYTGDAEDVSASAREYAVARIRESAKGDPRRSMRPVTAEVIGDKTLPLNVYVMTDGIGLAAVILNPNSKDVTVRVKSHLADLKPIEGDRFALPPTGSKLLYFENRSQQVIEACKNINKHLTETKRRVRQLKEKGYDVDSAEAVLSYVDRAGSALSPEKILAAVVRIQRMVFAKVGGNCTKVDVVGIDRRPLQGVEVQLQYPLQFNARRDAGVTDAGGTLVVDPTPPDVERWDFEEEKYITADGRLIRFRFQHPDYLTETTQQHQHVPSKR